MHLKGRYGIEMKVSARTRGPSPLRLVMLFVLAAVAVAFVLARGCGRPRGPAAPRQDQPAKPLVRAPDPPARELGPAGLPPEAPSPQLKPPEEIRVASSNAFGKVDLRGASRSPDVRALLDRLVEADRRGDLMLQIDAIERLRKRKDEVADIDDTLARRLGNLNYKLFLEGKTNPWVAPHTVQPRETVERIARDHGATVAAVLLLNGIGDPRRLRLGATLRVPDRPRVKLKVHVASQIADLEVNGKFFRRFDVKVAEGVALGEREVTRAEGGGPRQLLEKAGVRLAEADLAQAALMLPAGAKIVLMNP